MSSEDADWDRFVAGVRTGDPESLRAFYQRYGPSLERVAGSAISPDMLRRFGPESIANSVCRTFMRRARGEELEVADADGMWRLLCAIALNKVRERVRFHRRERRAIGRELRGEDALDRAPAVRTPGPEEAAMFRDQLEDAVASLDEDERRVLELRLAGLTEEQVATEMACSERTVRRVMRRLDARLTAAFGE